MQLSYAFQLATLLGIATAGLVPSDHVVHEKREVPHPDLNRRVPSDFVLPVRFGLKQNEDAMKRAEDWLMEVSHPGSAMYGQHWSQDEVIEAFKPSDERVSTVASWLIKSGIAKDRITHSDNKAWLAFDATVEEVESLLHTEYFHDGQDHALVAVHEYHLPKHISEHIDYVTPGVKGIKTDLRPRGKRASNPVPRHLHRQQRQLSPLPPLPVNWKPTDLSTCDKLITPACLQALYHFKAPDAKATVCKNNSLGVFEEGDFYSQEDFNAFFERYTPHIPKGTGPILDSVDGGMAPVPPNKAGSESNLDFELAYPIIYPQTTTLYQNDDLIYATDPPPEVSGAFNTFLDAIDGSYCTYSAYGEKGNDPGDPKYPNPNPKGYQGPLMCGVYKPTNVISISYGLQESDLPAYYQKRQCNEYLKLGLQGVSIFFASGDSGVASRTGCLRNNEVFSPTAPNSCPWLTNVGATQILPGKKVTDPESAAFENTHKSFNFSSGGGFSNLFPIPLYQLGAVESYLTNHNPSYPHYSNGHYQNSTGIYNRNGRGIPDVAANGDKIAVVSNGKSQTAAGTSASTPIFAALINRIIEERIKIGKGPLGFINPVLYSSPWVLNDIKTGSNPGCGTMGFNATEGWDPVTGLGTPNYPKMLELFLALP